MLLAIDIGNSNIVFGIHHENRWLNRWRIRTVSDKMPDEYAALFHNLFSNDGIVMEHIERTVIGSVVPPLLETFSSVIHSCMRHQPLIVAPGIHTGIRIRTDNPVEVGADLVANAVAAFYRFQSNCIIVDFGTALTFTAVNKQGDLMGVAIAPGIKLAMDSLFKETAQLSLVKLSPPPKAIGRNTTHSIQSGIMFGYIGLVESLVDRMSGELEGDSRIIATGGYSQTFNTLTNRFDEIDPWLTLEGLKIIA